MIKRILMIIAVIGVTCFMGYRPELMAMASMVPMDLSGHPMADAGMVFLPLGLIVNTQTLAAIFKAFSTIFNQAFQGVMPEWSKIAMRVPSMSAENLYAWLGSFPKMREWVGDRHIKNLKTHDYTIVNKDYELTIEVPRNAIADDQIGVFNPIVAEFGRSAATHVDELVFGLLETAHQVVCYDGQFFFDTDHPVGDGVVSNDLAGGQTPWYLLDTSRAIKPFIYQDRQPDEFVAMTSAQDSEHVCNTKNFIYGNDARRNVGVGLWQLAIRSEATLDATAYDAARSAMRAFKDDHGKPLGVKPTLMVVPPSLEGVAKRLITAEKDADGADNIWFNSVELLVSDWLG